MCVQGPKQVGHDRLPSQGAGSWTGSAASRTGPRAPLRDAAVTSRRVFSPTMLALGTSLQKRKRTKPKPVTGQVLILGGVRHQQQLPLGLWGQPRCRTRDTGMDSPAARRETWPCHVPSVTVLSPSAMCDPVHPCTALLSGLLGEGQLVTGTRCDI